MLKRAHRENWVRYSFGTFVFCISSVASAGKGETCSPTDLVRILGAAKGASYWTTPQVAQLRIPLEPLARSDSEILDACTVDVSSPSGDLEGLSLAISRASSLRPFDELLWEAAGPIPVGLWTAQLTCNYDALDGCEDVTPTVVEQLFTVSSTSADELVSAIEVVAEPPAEHLGPVALACCEVNTSICDDDECYQCWNSVVQRSRSFRWNHDSSLYVDVSLQPDSNHHAAWGVGADFSQRFWGKADLCVSAEVGVVDEERTSISTICSIGDDGLLRIPDQPSRQRAPLESCLQTPPGTFRGDEELLVVRAKTEKAARTSRSGSSWRRKPRSHRRTRR